MHELRIGFHSTTSCQSPMCSSRTAAMEVSKMHLHARYQSSSHLRTSQTREILLGEWNGHALALISELVLQPEELKKAVQEIFSHGKYKKRALEIKTEITTYNHMAIITGAIDKVAAS